MEQTPDGFRPGARAFEITGDFFRKSWKQFVRLHPLITALALRQLWLARINRQDFLALPAINNPETLEIMQLPGNKEAWQFLTRLETGSLHYGDIALLCSLLHSPGWQLRTAGCQTLDQAIALNLWPDIRNTRQWTQIANQGLTTDSFALLRPGQRVERQIASINAASSGKSPGIDRASYQALLGNLTRKTDLDQLSETLDAPESAAASLVQMVSAAFTDTRCQVAPAKRITALTTLPKQQRQHLAANARLGMAAVIQIKEDSQTTLACFQRQQPGAWSPDHLFQLQLLRPRKEDTPEQDNGAEIASALAGKLTTNPVSERESKQTTVDKHPVQVTTLLFQP